MKLKILLILAVGLPLLLASVWAADVTGKWQAEQQGRNGTVQTTFTFKVDGTNLTGTVSGRGGDTEISEGKIDGDNISFAVVRSFGGNEIKIVYKGKVAGDEITFTREFEGGGFGGGMGGGGGRGPGGGQGRPPLIAKRVK